MLSNHLPNDLILTGRGSTALYVILKVLEESSFEIIIPANICEVVVATIRQTRINISFSDVDPYTGNSNLEQIAKAASSKTAILLCVPNFGSTVNVEEIANWCRQQQIFMITDLCNALGATWKNKSLHEYSDAAIYSFGYAKIFEYGVGGGLWVRSNRMRFEAKGILSQLSNYTKNTQQKIVHLNNELIDFRDSKESPYDSYAQLYDAYVQCLIFKLCESDLAELSAAINQHDLQFNLQRRLSIGEIYRGISKCLVTHRKLNDGDIIWRYTVLAMSKEARETLVKKLRSQGFIVSTWYPCVVGLFNENWNPELYKGAQFFGDRVFNLFVDHRISLKTAKELTAFLNHLSSNDYN